MLQRYVVTGIYRLITDEVGTIDTIDPLKYRRQIPIYD
jgi:hypothetical protein